MVVIGKREHEEEQRRYAMDQQRSEEAEFCDRVYRAVNQSWFVLPVSYADSTSENEPYTTNKRFWYIGSFKFSMEYMAGKHVIQVQACLLEGPTPVERDGQISLVYNPGEGVVVLEHDDLCPPSGQDYQRIWHRGPWDLELRQAVEELERQNTAIVEKEKADKAAQEAAHAAFVDKIKASFAARLPK